MSIQPTATSSARIAGDAVPAQATARAEPVPGKPVEAGAAPPSRAELKDAVANINKSMQALSQSLEFSIDEDSQRTIVKIVDVATKEVIRQIPTPEALQISKALDTVKGLLIRQSA
ncbi:MAG: flagellar protein FlaG [Gammaproteobacteria bacterium]